VKVFHFMVKHWGQSVTGLQNCGSPSLRCEWIHADHLPRLKQEFIDSIKTSETITLSVYNIHSWWEKRREHAPAICELRTNLTLVESEESKVRYHGLFNPSFKNFDGYSTTHPQSNIQRVYAEVFLNDSSSFVEMGNFSSLIKGASYVASDCHKRDSANANRDVVVGDLRRTGFRADGLGQCMRTPTGPEGVHLPKTHDTRYNLVLKRQAISKYMFNLAFENSLESGNNNNLETVFALGFVLIAIELLHFLFFLKQAT